MAKKAQSLNIFIQNESDSSVWDKLCLLQSRSFEGTAGVVTEVVTPCGAQAVMDPIKIKKRQPANRTFKAQGVESNDTAFEYLMRRFDTNQSFKARVVVDKIVGYVADFKVVDLARAGTVDGLLKFDIAMVRVSTSLLKFVSDGNGVIDFRGGAYSDDTFHSDDTGFLDTGMVLV